MRTPIEIDGVELLCEVFAQVLGAMPLDQCDRIVTIEDKSYRLRVAEPGVFYTMFRIRGHQRTVRGSLPDMLRVIGTQHLIYKRYEARVHKAKEDAQRERDRRLNELVEARA